MTATSATRGVGFRSERGPVLVALMLTTALVAIDSTIVATAVPSIVDDIGGFTSFPWLFSSYLLAQAVTVPIYAKLSDMIGRKPVVFIGIGLFLLGSVLCGFAWSMPVLIAARLVQGLGAGAVQPMAITIAGDIYTVAERAKVQGYLASVWAVSAVLGPTLGGTFASLGIWRAIFFVNVPVCLLAAWMLARSFHESVGRERHRVDVLGATLLTVALSLLMLALLEGGHAWAWDSPAGITIVVAGAVLLVLFVLVERRAAEPVLPAFVFTRRLLLTTTLIAFGVGAVLLGLTSYVPTYLQGVLGADPIVAGLALATLTIGWPIAASLSGRIYLRLGFRATNLIGVTLAVTGTGVLAIVVALSPTVLLVATGCFVVGLGLGFTSTPSIVAAQSSVEWSERGVVTGTNMFSRSVGSAFGVAVFGALSNAVYARLGNHGPDAIAEASSAVFLAAVVAAVLIAAAVLAMPKVMAPPA
ncbi:MFS transporter [Georgenia yuyongxinii]|uniref:MFS transporter n=1 Tax=Georgenia yuyongxinii TaxID=2589797 RepID=A0A552WTN1_9MICO|nr:MFS transporter [Georgenia yuyongxinii]TRW46097.1 MFS transporter [Georgenia yuyongxinii]